MFKMHKKQNPTKKKLKIGRKKFGHFGLVVWGGHVTAFSPITLGWKGNSQNPSVVPNKTPVGITS